MLKNKKRMITILMLLGLMAFETSCGKEKKQDLEGTTSPSENNLLYLETKSPQIINKQDDTEYTTDLSSFDHGTATYSVEADLFSMSEDNLDVTYPVFYVEKLVRVPFPITLIQSLETLKKDTILCLVLLWRSLERMLLWRLPACYAGMLPQNLKL